MVNLRESADGGEILGGGAQDLLELCPRLFETPGLEQRAAQGDAGRQVGGMPLQSRFTDGNRVLELSAAAIFLRERGEGDRRRIQLDPASQFLDASAVGHAQ